MAISPKSAASSEATERAVARRRRHRARDAEEAPSRPRRWRRAARRRRPPAPSSTGRAACTRRRRRTRRRACRPRRRQTPAASAAARRRTRRGAPADAESRPRLTASGSSRFQQKEPPGKRASRPIFESPRHSERRACRAAKGAPATRSRRPKAESERRRGRAALGARGGSDSERAAGGEAWNQPHVSRARVGIENCAAPAGPSVMPRTAAPDIATGQPRLKHLDKDVIVEIFNTSITSQSGAPQVCQLFSHRQAHREMGGATAAVDGGSRRARGSRAICSRRRSRTRSRGHGGGAAEAADGIRVHALSSRWCLKRDDVESAWLN